MRYEDITMILLLYLPLIDMYDYLHNPLGSLPKVLILEQNGWRVIITGPSGLYKPVHTISVLEVEMWECLKYHFVVVLKDASPWGCCQWGLFSSKQIIPIYNWCILSHISSNVWWTEVNSKLFTFWKRIRVCLFSFVVAVRSPNRRLLCRSVLEHRKESSSRD